MYDSMKLAMKKLGVDTPAQLLNATFVLKFCFEPGSVFLVKPSQIEITENEVVFGFKPGIEMDVDWVAAKMSSELGKKLSQNEVVRVELGSLEHTLKEGDWIASVCEFVHDDDEGCWMEYYESEKHISVQFLPSTK